MAITNILQQHRVVSLYIDSENRMTRIERDFSNSADAISEVERLKSSDTIYIVVYRNYALVFEYDNVNNSYDAIGDITDDELAHYRITD